MSGTNQEMLRALIRGAGMTRRQAADALHVSEHTVLSWLKPGSSKSSAPVPMWAVELLARKTRQWRNGAPVPADPDQATAPESVSSSPVGSNE